MCSERSRPNLRTRRNVFSLLVSAGVSLGFTRTAISMPLERVPVYFDFNSALVTPAGVRILEYFAVRFVEDSRENGSPIAISAHTDRAEASEPLARARGQSVFDCLLKLGLPGQQMQVFAYADQRLAVETAPHVREVRNRRVEISRLGAPAEARSI